MHMRVFSDLRVRRRMLSLPYRSIDPSQTLCWTSLLEASSYGSEVICMKLDLVD